MIAGEITTGEWLGAIPMVVIFIYMMTRKTKSNRLEGKNWWQ